MFKLFEGDVLKTLKKFHTVNCVVTSPPYYLQRDYGVDGQHGREKTLQEYVDQQVAVFNAIGEKMPDTGTLWINLGDKYLNGKLAGAPWRVALSLIDSGWVLKNDIIWNRNRIMPDSAKNRFTKSHEYLFFFTKKATGFTFNADAVREPAKWAHDRRAGKGRHVYAESRGSNAHTAAVFIAEDGKRNRRTVWTIETSQGKQHFATFPLALPELCILAGSNPGDTVLDPYVGTGTCGEAALKHGRNFVGIDINPEFIQISRQRLKTV